MAENVGGNEHSIRCRRHHKRFVVSKEWADKCNWLCPTCYERMTEAERAEYAPTSHGGAGGESVSKQGEGARVRTVLRHTATTKKPQEKAKRGRPPKTKNGLPQRTVAKVDADAAKEFQMKAMSPELMRLLPKYRIKCRKCGEVRPCHASWFSQSQVLCPECYSLMTEDEIRVFHKEHKADGTETLCVVECPKGDKQCTSSRADEDIHSVFAKKCKAEDAVDSYKACSVRFISKATAAELEKAVADGIISKVRAKIELKRRRNKAYYRDRPNDDLPSIIFG